MHRIRGLFHMSGSLLSTGEQIESIWKLGGLTCKELARRVWGGINQNDLINRAYELAYNFLLALFPILLFLVALLGALASEGSRLRSDLFFYIQPVLPPAAYHLLVTTLEEVTQSPVSTKLTFGLLFALIAGTGGMTQLISTLNETYEVREGRSWLKVHLISLALTIGVSLLIIVALIFAVGAGWLLQAIGGALSLGPSVFIVVRVLHWVVVLGFVILSFATLYYFAPDVKDQHWYWITPGSVAGVVLWALASAGLRGYLHFFNTYTRTYGSLGAVIILMLWFYVTGLAILIGGEINATIEHAAAEHGHPEAKPVGKKAA
jgi:membrane protein